MVIVLEESGHPAEAMQCLRAVDCVTEVRRLIGAPPVAVLP